MIDLYNCDCLEMFSALPDDSIDCVICDPPYGTTRAKWDDVVDFTALWESIHRVTKDTAPIVLFGAQPFTTHMIMSNIRNYRYSWVWVKNRKTGFLNAKRQPLRKTEDIMVFYKKQSTYNPQKSTGHKPVNYAVNNNTTSLYGSHGPNVSGGATDRYPSNVLEFDTLANDGSGEKRYHPTQKPIALLEYLVKTYTDAGDTVLDFTMGSGTTGVACEAQGRSFVGCEIDQGYFEIAEKRIRGELQ